MRKLQVSLLGVALLVLVGCDAHQQPGGPGASRDPGQTTAQVFSQPENTFTLSLPTLSTHLKQGEKKQVNIGIHRGKNFDQDVKLEFKDIPQGVKLTPSSAVLRASEKEVELTVEAGADAALGDHTIAVAGTPMRAGQATSSNFKITISKP
jgi:hypothetical protein